MTEAQEQQASENMVAEGCPAPMPTFPADPQAPARAETVEEEIRRKGLTAPRVTDATIDAAIVGEEYHVFPGTTTTVCGLKLANGFVVVGESACASPENFNAELGRRIARTDARRKIWALEGYALRNQLAASVDRAA